MKCDCPHNEYVNFNTYYESLELKQKKLGFKMTGKQQIIANLFLDFGNMVFESDYGQGNNVEVENVLNDFKDTFQKIDLNAETIDMMVC